MNKWKGHSIEDVKKCYGDYTICIKGEGVYHWAHVTEAFGRGRTHGKTFKTDNQGTIETSFYYDQTWNLFGYLPFYADILELNIYTPRGDLMVDNDAFHRGKIREYTFWHDGILMYFLYCLTPALLLGLLVFIVSLNKSVSNMALTMISVAGSMVITYVMGITFLEYCHGHWMLLIMAYVFLATLWFWIPFGLVEFKRCPKCRQYSLTNTLSSSTRKKYQITVASSYPRSGSMPEVELSYSDTTPKIHVSRCKRCSYTSQSEMNQETRLSQCPKCHQSLSRCIKRDVHISNVSRSYGSVSTIDFDLTVSAHCSCGKFSFGPFTFKNQTVSKSQPARTSRRGSGIHFSEDKKDLLRRRGYFSRENCVYYTYDGCGVGAGSNNDSYWWSRCRSGYEECDKCPYFSPRNNESSFMY